MKIIEKIMRNRILQHLVFWGISFYILLKNFETTSVIVPVDLIFTGIFMIFLFLGVYINLLMLIPRLFQQGRYVLYFFIVCLLLVANTYCYMYGFDFIVDLFFDGFYLISYFDFWDTLKYFVIFLGLSSLLHFSKSWFLYRESEAQLAKIQKEKIEAELDALKNQINPHFLFNSLNSIYSLVLKKSDLAPEALIRLSDSMRYIIYESDEEKVPLIKEIAFINNYIELQKLRMSTKDQLQFNVTGKIKDQHIAPLLMIPIIENAFKYGIKGETEASFVSLEIKIAKHMFSMLTINNLGLVDHVEIAGPKGTGLNNLKKRLELIYPEHHLLKIDETADKFVVDLNIEL
jgi:sensor histidine kinase YesM